MNSGKSNPIVSVVIPTYNHANELKVALESIINQTITSWEVWVINNHSEDNTIEVIESFNDSRIHYVDFHNNGIIAKSRNEGIRRSSGDIIAFLDSDDIWLPKKLEKQLNHIKADGICSIASEEIPVGDVIYSRKYSFFPPKEEFHDYSYHEIALRNRVATSSLITKKEHLLKLEGFDESLDFRFIEDWELWLRMSTIGNIRILSEPLIKYRITKNNQRDLRTLTLGTLKVLEKHYRLGYLDDHEIMQKASGNCYVDVGKAFLDANDPGGVQYYKMGLRYSYGFHNKMRSIIGLTLFCVPEAVRPKIISGLYWLNSFLTNAMKRLLSV